MGDKVQLTRDEMFAAVSEGIRDAVLMMASDSSFKETYDKFWSEFRAGVSDGIAAQGRNDPLAKS